MNRWYWLLAISLISNTASADVRLLIRFDESGHFLHRLFPVAPEERLAKSTELSSSASISAKISQPTIGSAPIARGRSIASASVYPASGRSIQGIDTFVRLVWKNSDGQQIAQTLLPDPRVVHSPTHINGIEASRTALTSGAWLATGPSEAASVTILLPESQPLGLAAETWSLRLSVE
ncbi:MAG: hypothetical protein AB8B84_01995 [Granulosicoccus sp.]